MILVVAFLYLAEGHRATALVAAVMGVSTLSYGTHTLRRERYLRLAVVVLLVLPVVWRVVVDR
ncbi:MAG: hypothetical protein ACE5F1_21065, partial [Planctomycetota bacterium]